MKRAIFIVAGVFLGGLLGFVVASASSQFYERVWATSGDIGTMEAFFLLGIWGSFVLAGGFVGNAFFRRHNPPSHSSDRPNQLRAELDADDNP